MGLLEQILRYLEDFSAKRLFLLFVVLILTAGAALYYERYTASFALTRLEKASLLLKELESSKYEEASAKEIAEMHREITKQLHALLVAEHNKSQNSEWIPRFTVPESPGVWKFVAGGSLWLLLALVLPLLTKGVTEKVGAFFGFFIVALFFGAVGSILPTIYWPWFNLVVYPALTFGVIILPAMAIPAFKKVRESSLKKAILNNLRMLSAAADQYFLENGVGVVEISQLVGPDKYIKTLISVSGENYDGMLIKQGQAIEVTTKQGETITYRP